MTKTFQRRRGKQVLKVRALSQMMTSNVSAGVRRWILGVVIMALGIAATLWAFDLVRARDQAARRNVLLQRSAPIAVALRHHLEAPIEILHGMRSLSLAHGTLSNDVFMRYVTPFLKRYPGITALEWAPYVSNEHRAALEAHAQRQGLTHFQISELGPDQSLIRTRERPSYIPIMMMAPTDTLALGFDLASEPSRRALVERARNEGRTVASPRFRMVEDADEVFSVAIYLPVYIESTRPRTQIERIERFEGLAILVFRLNDQVKHIFEAVDEELAFALVDVTEGDDVPLFKHGGDALALAQHRDADVHRIEVPMLNRRWSLIAVDQRAATISDSAWVTLIAGLAISILLGVALSASGTILKLRRDVAQARELGQYNLVEALGAGSMGQVYIAEHAMMRRRTALKLLADTADNELAARFEREVQLTCQLSHPNIITIFDFGRAADGTFYYAMELLDGLSLQELVEDTGPLPPQRVIHVLIQACSALSEAHSVGLIHRDIKPANLMLTCRGLHFDVVKVLDFGLVKHVFVPGHEKTGLTITRNDQMILGTPDYIAPESVEDPRSANASSDIYSLGAVGYFLLCGQTLFDAPSALQMFFKHLNEDPVPPSQRTNQAIPGHLEALIMQCLAKDPAERPVSAQALEASLRNLQRRDFVWAPDDAQAWWEGYIAHQATLMHGSPRVSTTDPPHPLHSDEETLTTAKDHTS